MESLIAQASSYAQEIDGLIHIITVLAGFWFLLAEAVLFYCLYKFSAKRREKADYITGEKKSEKKWIHWPHNSILVCDVVIIFFAIQAWYGIKQDMPTPDSTIKIIGQQWAWKFEQPGADNKLGTEDDVKTVDILNVVVGRTYRFELTSDDVMHSFSVPVFRLKQDAVPGRMISGWFKPTLTGEFDIQCAEMCGIGHGIMAARIIIRTEEEHKKWLDSMGSTASSVALGGTIDSKIKNKNNKQEVDAI